MVEESLPRSMRVVDVITCQSFPPLDLPLLTTAPHHANRAEFFRSPDTNQHSPGFGAMAGLNLFAAMGLNLNDPNMMRLSESLSESSSLAYYNIYKMQSMLNNFSWMYRRAKH
jgi:hypothetical protein